MAESFTISQAAAQLARADAPWFGINSTSRDISYTWLDSAPSYTAGSLGAVATGFRTFSTMQETAAVRALELIEDVANVNFTFTDSDSIAQLRFGNTSAPGVGGFAYLPSAPSEFDGDIWLPTELSYLDAGIGTATRPDYGEYGFLTVLHEIGHAVGLLHPGNYNGGAPTYGNDAAYTEDSRQYSIMSYFDASNTGAQHGGDFASTPLLHDVAALQLLYGANTTTRTGDTVYGFNASSGIREIFDFSGTTTAPIVTIWDAGGVDTIDLSGYSQSSVLNLNAATFSDVGGRTSNLSIADTVVIENAITGNGNDVVTGNAVNNTISTGAGNDLIIASAGVDTIDGGAGVSDTLQLSKASTAYSGTTDATTGVTTIQEVGTNNTYQLTNVEELVFLDQSISVQNFVSNTSSSSPILFVADVSLVEGNSNSSQTLRVQLTNALSDDTTFTYTVQSGTALATSDYIFASGTGNIVAGNTFVDLSYTLVGDSIRENDETFSVELSNVSINATLSTTSNISTITITNDDTQVVDDHGNDATNATALTITDATTGVSALGDLETRGDRDWFKISLDANTSYNIDIDARGSGAGSLRDSYLRVHDAQGNIIALNDDGGKGLDSSLTYTTAAGDGTAVDYYVSVGSYGDYWTGSYKLDIAESSVVVGSDTISQNTSTTGVITLDADGNGNQTGTLEFEGDRDWFKVNLDAGNYQVFLRGDGDDRVVDTFLRIYDDAGSLVAQNDDSGFSLNSSTTINVATAGDYFVSAGSYVDFYTGDYAIDVSKLGGDDFSNDTSTSGAITVDATSVATGTLEYRGDRDWFEVDLIAGEAYNITLNGAATNGVRDTFLRIYDSNSTLVALNDDGGPGLNSALSFTASATSAYYVEAGSYRDASLGDYEVSVSTLNDDFSTNASTIGRISIGTTSYGELEVSGDRDWFMVSLDAGTYSIRLTGGGENTTDPALSDTFLRVLDLNGTLVAANDDGGLGLNSALTFTVATDADYYISAASFADRFTGHYHIDVVSTGNAAGSGGGDYSNDINTVGSLTLNQTESSQLETRGDRDWFAIDLTAGTTYNITLNGVGRFGVRDTFLRIYDDAGVFITQDDDSGLGLNSALSFSATETGTYFIEAASYFNFYSGNYNLRVSDAAATSAALVDHDHDDHDDHDHDHDDHDHDHDHENPDVLSPEKIDDVSATTSATGTTDADSDEKDLVVLRISENTGLEEENFSFLSAEMRDTAISDIELRLVNDDGEVITPANITYSADVSLSVASNASDAVIQAAIMREVSNVAEGDLNISQVTFNDNEEAVFVYFNGDESNQENDVFSYFAGIDDTSFGTLTSSVGNDIVDDGTLVGSRYSIEGDARIYEGDSGMSTVSFVVTRTGDIDQSGSVDFFIDPSNTNGVDASDFENNTLPRGTIQFATNEVSRTVEFKISNDDIEENDESFTVHIDLLNENDTVLTGAGEQKYTLYTDERVDSAIQNFQNGSVGNNVLYLGSDIREQVRGGLGDDSFIVTKFAESDTIIFDQFGDNDIIFDSGVSITNVRTVSFDSEIIITLSNNHEVSIGNGYKNFDYIVGDNSAIDYTAFINTYTSGVVVDSFATIENQVNVTDEVTNFFNGDELSNNFIISTDQAAQYRGGLGDDNYVVTRFVTSSNISLFDAVGGDIDTVIFDSGVSITDITSNSFTGSLVVDLDTGASINIDGARNFYYQIGTEGAITYDEFIAETTDDPAQSYVNERVSGGVFASGSDGDDDIEGKEEDDIFEGGTGADNFIFDLDLDSSGNIAWGSNNGSDTILDFNQGEGDRIDIRTDSNINLQQFQQLFESGQITASTQTDAYHVDYVEIDFGDGTLSFRENEQVNGTTDEQQSSDIDSFDDLVAALGGGDVFNFS